MKHRLIKIAPDLVTLILANLLIVWYWFEASKKFEFVNPAILWGLLIVPFVGVWLIYKKFREHPTVKLSSYGFIPAPYFPFARVMYALSSGFILVSIGLLN